MWSSTFRKESIQVEVSCIGGDSFSGCQIIVQIFVTIMTQKISDRKIDKNTPFVSLLVCHFTSELYIAGAQFVDAWLALVTWRHMLEITRAPAL